LHELRLGVDCRYARHGRGTAVCEWPGSPCGCRRTVGVQMACHAAVPVVLAEGANIRPLLVDLYAETMHQSALPAAWHPQHAARSTRR